MSAQVAVFFLCACGCGKELRGKRMFFPGHKPKKIKKTREELSAAHKAQWERWREKHPEKQLKPCNCGCGEMVKGTWAWGHHSRVKNISKRADVKEKRRENFVKLHEEGRLPNWNRGLTKEDDDRLAKCGRPVDVLSTEERHERSEKMKSQWESGNIVPLSGPNHPQWQGGTSSISQIVRGSGNLYREWRYPIMIRDGFRCRDCNRTGTGDLNVHHDQERFADILRTCIRIFFDATYREYDRNDPSTWPELSWDEKKAIEMTVVSYHTSRNISGVTLCYGCHGKVHETEKDED